MKLIIENDVVDLMKKNNATFLIVDAIKGATSGGCSCGITRTFHTTEVRQGFSGNVPGQDFEKYESEGVDVFINRKALPAIEGDLRIFLEKTFLSKKIALDGIKEMVFEE